MLRRMNGPASRTARQGGFTLLEVLLAFVVFALSFAVVLEILSSSMRSTVRARHYTEAALLAQTLIDQVGTEIYLEDGVFDGESPGGYRWTVSISTFVPQTAEEDFLVQLAEANGTSVYWVDVDLRWGEGARAREARFTTVRSTLRNVDS